MRAAPAVRASLAGTVPEQQVIAALHLLAGAGLAAWAWGHAALAPTWPVALAAAAWLAAWAALGLRLARSALPDDGDFLQWDGAAWALGLRSPGQSCATPAALRLDRVGLALDLGAWVLLRLQPASGGQRWQVARASRAGSDWHGLRLALTAHASRAAAPSGAST